jgi:hypothetical protein
MVDLGGENNLLGSGGENDFRFFELPASRRKLPTSMPDGACKPNRSSQNGPVDLKTAAYGR